MKVPEIFWDWWSASDEGVQVMAEATQAEVTEREAMVQGIAELRKGLTRDLPALLKGVDTALKEFMETQQALTDAEQGVRRARAAEQDVRLRADSQIAQLEQRLRAGAHPGIHEFLSELADVWPRERLRWASDPLKRRDGSRMPARERVDQIRAIRLQAEALYYEPDPEAASAELERLRDAVALPTPKEVVVA